MAQETVRPAAAVDTWTSFVKGGLGALGLALLAVGPFVPTPDAFGYLPHYAYVLGGILVLTAATMRLRSVLVVLGCVALTAALAFTLAGGSTGAPDMAALLLYSAAGLVFGAVARREWMVAPFLLVPVLVVAPHGGDWTESREAFSLAWTAALDCDCLLAGLPAALAVVGAAVGEFRRNPWPTMRPSGVPLLIACGGLVMAGLVLASLLPPNLDFVRTVALRTALLAGVLGWVVLSYQVGRVSFVWQAALACLLLLAGALFLDRATQFPQALGPTLVITIATSLMPAVLAAVGLLVRKWIGTERPRVAPVTQLAHDHAPEGRSFFAPAPTPEPVLPTPLSPTGLAPPPPKPPPRRPPASQVALDPSAGKGDEVPAADAAAADADPKPAESAEPSRPPEG